MRTPLALGVLALTGASALALTPSTAHAQACASRTKLMVCGSTSRAVADIYTGAPGLTVVSSCAPDSDTKAMLVPRSGVPNANNTTWIAYLNGGGVIISEATRTHEMYNAMFGTAYAKGPRRGDCSDNAMPTVKLNPSAPFWTRNPGLTTTPTNIEGCGEDLRDLVAAEGLLPLGRWDSPTDSVSFAVREVGAGLLYLLEADWQDNESGYNDDSRAFMGALITSCGQCTSNADCAAGAVCDLLGSNTCEPANTCGNGTLDAGEACDDGGVAAGDGCSATCLIEDGQACVNNAQCATGFCDPDGNICACDDDADCSAGYVCDTTLAPNACQPAINYSLAITAPTAGAALNTSTPTISGTTEAGLVVTVTIDGVTGTATANAAGAWTFTPAASLAEGAHTVSVSVDDGLGNTASAGPVAFTTDTILPDTEIVSPAHNSFVNTDAPTISGTTEPGASVLVSVDGNAVGTVTGDAAGAWSVPTSGLAEGLHTISARATDAAGNFVFALAKEFTVDTIAPVTTITTPTAGALVNSTFTISGTSEPLADVVVTVDGVAIGTVTADAAGDWSLALPNTADGAHTISATGEDRAGNVGAAATAGFTLDTTPPAPTITSPANNSFVNTSALAISGTTEPGASVEVSLDGFVAGTVTADAAGAWSLSAPGQTDGAHLISVMSTDLAGNTGGPATAGVTIDTIAPSPTIALPTPDLVTDTDKPAFNGTTEANATVTITVDGNVLGTVTADAAGAWAFASVNGLPEGAHTVSVTSADQAGNTGSAGPVAFTTDTIDPAPTIVQPAEASYTSNRTPTIGGTTEASAAVTVIVRDAAGAEIETLTTTADAATGAWSVDVTVSLVDGAYTIAVTSTDAAANEGSTSGTFNVDATALPLTLDAPTMGEATSDARPDITGTTSANAEVTVTLTDDAGAEVEVITATADANGDWTATPTADLAEGDYTAEATVANIAGLESSASTTFTVDQTAPAVTLTSPTDGAVIGEASPTFVGASEPGAAITVILRDAAGATLETLTTTADAAGAWSVPATTTLGEGDTTVVVSAADAAGNETDLPAITLTVDTVVPATTITSPTDGGASTDATPTISGTGEPGATVEVTVDGVVLDTVTVGADGTWSVTPGADLADGSHTIDVNSTDAAGNVADTTSITFTVDTTPPDVTITSPTADTPITSLPATVTGTSEPGATIEVFVDGTSVGSATADASGAWTLELPTIAEGSHTVRATATDANGLSRETDEITISVTLANTRALEGDGCGCGTSPTRGPDGTLGLWALALGGVLLRRRRRA